MANNFTPVGNEIQVNQPPEQVNPQSNADVAVMTDGRFFVAFQDDFDGDGDIDIMGQFVNPDGTVSTQSDRRERSRIRGRQPDQSGGRPARRRCCGRGVAR